MTSFEYYNQLLMLNHGVIRYSSLIESERFDFILFSVFDEADPKLLVSPEKFPNKEIVTMVVPATEFEDIRRQI